MAKPEDETAAGGEPAPGAPATGSRDALPTAAADADGAPPAVESPPLSPVGEPVRAAAADATAQDVAIAPAEIRSQSAEDSLPRRKGFRWMPTPRRRRRMLRAASFVAAAGLGGLIGAFAMHQWALPKPDMSGLDEYRALQHSLAQLGREMAALKTDLDRANRRVLDQAVKPQNSDQAARLERTEQDVTGTIPSKPPGVESLPHMAPLPPPRPRTVASSGKPPVLRDWWIRDARGGYVFVEGHGDVYQVVPGAPLPGLGPVQAIKRENGAWVVVTPEGLIVADRDRSRFE